MSCITSPVNVGSIAFHRAMGFRLKRGDREEGGVPIHGDYDGPGEDRVVCSRKRSSEAYSIRTGNAHRSGI